MGVKIDGKLASGLTMTMTHQPSQKTLDTDPPVDNGGEGRSFSPTDLVATAYGSCMMSIIALMARRDGVDLSGMSVHVEKHMSQDTPRRISALDIRLDLPASLDAATRDKYIQAAKHCPVAKSVHPDINIRFSAG